MLISGEAMAKAAYGHGQIAKEPEYASDSIGAKLSELSGLLEQINKQAAHLCGARPEQGTELRTVSSGGLFSEWEDRLCGMIARAREIRETFSRATGQ